MYSRKNLPKFLHFASNPNTNIKWAETVRGFSFSPARKKIHSSFFAASLSCSWNINSTQASRAHRVVYRSSNYKSSCSSIKPTPECINFFSPRVRCLFSCAPYIFLASHHHHHTKILILACAPLSIWRRLTWMKSMWYFEDSQDSLLTKRADPSDAAAAAATRGMNNVIPAELLCGWLSKRWEISMNVEPKKKKNKLHALLLSSHRWLLCLVNQQIPRAWERFLWPERREIRKKKYISISSFSAIGGNNSAPAAAVEQSMLSHSNKYQWSWCGNDRTLSRRTGMWSESFTSDILATAITTARKDHRPSRMGKNWCVFEAYKTWHEYWLQKLLRSELVMPIVLVIVSSST